MMRLSVLFLCTFSFVGCVERLPSAASAETSDQPRSAFRTAMTDTIFTDSIGYLMGRFDPAEHPDFELVRPEHADRTGMYIRSDTYAAFQAMFDAALADGIRLQIRSATRNFDAQKSIWERKWRGEMLIEGGQDATVAFPDPLVRARMILRFSSMPGTSRHHWGTDIDLNAFDNAWFESGEGLRLYQWLTEHARSFGFCQPYSEKGESRPHGYEEEKWHWSYMPVSLPLTRFAARVLTDTMIAGFDGAETAIGIAMVRNYILSIDERCRKL